MIKLRVSNEDVDLLPCPFCGAENSERLVYDFDRYENEYSIVCSVRFGGCGASTGICRTVEKAVKAWNRRTCDG